MNTLVRQRQTVQAKNGNNNNNNNNSYKKCDISRMGPALYLEDEKDNTHKITIKLKGN